MAEKLCMFCTQMFIEDDRGMGSTWTGPYGDIGPTCKKRHFEQWKPEGDDHMAEYRELILQAGECPDYDQVKV